MPVNGIVRLRHPVVLRGKVQQLGRDSLSLQSRKRRSAMRDGHSEIKTTVNDKRWCLPVIGEHGRIPSLIILSRSVVQRRTNHVVLREPQLIGFKVLDSHVEHAIVRNQCPELGRVAVDPVHHPRAVRRAKSHDSSRIDDVERLCQVIQRSENILVRLASIIITNRVRERLTITLRAVEINIRNSKSGASINLRIPAVRPIVDPRALRTAVNQIRHRNRRSAWIRLVRQYWRQVPAVDLITLCACEPNILRRGKHDFLEHHGVELYEPPSTVNGAELQKTILHFASDGLGQQPLLVFLLMRSASIGPETAMELLTSALQLITRTFYSTYLEKLVYYGVDMKVEMDVQIKRLDKDPLARSFIKTYLDILEMDEPESSYDASVQTHMYKEKYPVIRRLFASGFLRSAFLRTRIEPLFQGENPPIELVIRAAMIGHKRVAQEMIDVKNTLLDIDIFGHNFPIDDEKELYSPSKHHLPRDVANVIVEFWFGYS